MLGCADEEILKAHKDLEHRSDTGEGATDLGIINQLCRITSHYQPMTVSKFRKGEKVARCKQETEDRALEEKNSKLLL